MKRVAAIMDERVVRAAAHPLRMRLLAMLNEKTASPSDLAVELGEPLGNVSYHVRTLAELGCIELVRTEPRRGAVEHHYRAIVRPILPTADWGKLPPSLRRAVSDSVLGQVGRDVRSAAKSGGFDRDDAHLTRMPVVLDEQGWAQVNELLEEVVEKVMDISAESAGRLQEDGGGEGLSSCLAMLLFETAPGKAGGPAVHSSSSKRRQTQSV